MQDTPGKKYVRVDREMMGVPCISIWLLQYLVGFSITLPSREGASETLVAGEHQSTIPSDTNGMLAHVSVTRAEPQRMLIK